MRKKRSRELGRRAVGSCQPSTWVYISLSTMPFSRPGRLIQRLPNHTVNQREAKQSLRAEDRFHRGDVIWIAAGFLNSPQVAPRPGWYKQENHKSLVLPPMWDGHQFAGWLMLLFDMPWAFTGLTCCSHSIKVTPASSLFVLCSNKKKYGEPRIFVIS